MKMGSKRDDEKEVEELLFEAMDMVILEQAASISSIPRHLETRFQLLKTFQSSTTQKPSSFPTQSCSNNLPHSSKNGEQTMKKLRQYEKWLLRETPKNISPPKSSDFGRGRFWCWGNKAWRRESKEERERNSEQDLRKMLEKARKEEERICADAEKVIKWVNYASAHMEPYIPH